MNFQNSYTQKFNPFFDSFFEKWDIKDSNTGKIIIKPMFSSERDALFTFENTIKSKINVKTDTFIYYVDKIPKLIRRVLSFPFYFILLLI